MAGKQTDAVAKRYKIQIKLEISELTDEGPVEFFDDVLTYSNAGYDVVIAVEQAMLQTTNKLADYGIIAAKGMGLGEKLKAIGIEVD